MQKYDFHFSITKLVITMLEIICVHSQDICPFKSKNFTNYITENTLKKSSLLVSYNNNSDDNNINIIAIFRSQWIGLRIVVLLI